MCLPCAKKPDQANGGGRFNSLKTQGYTAPFVLTLKATPPMMAVKVFTGVKQAKHIIRFAEGEGSKRLLFRQQICGLSCLLYAAVLLVSLVRA